MKYLILLLSIFIQLAAVATSCGQLSKLTTPDSSIDNGKISTSVAFDLIDNRTFIDVKFNGKPFRVLFDSGAGYIITPEVAKALNLKVESAGQEGGVGEKKVDSGRTHIADMQIGDLHVKNHEFAVISFADAPNVFGSAQFDGIIGSEVLERFVTKVDYENNRLEFTRPDKFKYTGGGIKFSYTKNGLVPLVNGEIDGVAGVFGIDTGARSSLLLFGPFTDNNNLRTKYAPKVEGITGWGIGGPVRSQVTRVKVFKLGSLEIYNVVTRLPLQKSGALTTSKMAGVVGADVLKQFNITFDDSRREVIFEKNRHFGAADTFDRAGMWIGQTGKIFEVLDVIAGSPAAEAGLKVGDKILAIDGQDTEKLLLPEVRLKLKNDAPQKRVQLLVETNGERRRITITLRDLV